MQSAETKQVMNSVLVDMPPEFIICNFQVKLFSNEECDYVLQLILVEISPSWVEPLFLAPMTLVELSHIFLKSVLVLLEKQLPFLKYRVTILISQNLLNLCDCFLLAWVIRAVKRWRIFVRSIRTISTGLDWFIISGQIVLEQHSCFLVASFSYLLLMVVKKCYNTY